MEILIRNSDSQPIYEQIVRQVSGQILSGALPPGTALPSIRALARDLKISVITTKRAYDELEAAGYLVTVAGEGSFKAGKMELSLSQVWGGIGLAHDPLADRYIVEKIVRTQMALAGAKRSTRLQARTEELRESFALLLKEDAR